DMETGKTLHAVIAHQDNGPAFSPKISDIAFSPDGKLLASTSEDTTARLWDVETRETLHRFRERNGNALSSVAFSPDGKTLAGGSYKTINLWDVQTGRYLRKLEDSINSKRLAFSPDGKTLISGNRYNTVHLLLNVKTGIELRKTITHTQSIGSIAFSPDGKILASGGLDNTVHLWDMQTGKLLQTDNVVERHSLASVAFRPDGKTVAGSGLDKTVFLWDVETGTVGPAPLEGVTEYQPASIGSPGACYVAFSPDGKKLAGTYYKGLLYLWDMQTGKRIRTITLNKQTDEHIDMMHGNSKFTSVTFSPDGSVLAIGCNDNTVRTWDAHTGATLLTLDKHSDTVFSVAFSPDGKILASGSADKTVRFWDAASGELIRTLEEHRGSVNSVAFSPDGKTLASNGGDGTVMLWEVSTGKQLRTLTGHKGSVEVAFSPDGKTLASGSWDGTVLLWDLAVDTMD
ncbi:PQQ-binding-like beta-propeller repeat protein, partial [Candidatus Poribacteria bacterium]|nr:PQQ-binding-like beta-propeller repeat protein [Candidatus Poribacteria bacterium]